MNWLFGTTVVSNWIIVLIGLFLLAEREIIRRQGVVNRHNKRTGDNRWWAVPLGTRVRLSTLLIPSHPDGNYIWKQVPGTWFYFRRAWEKGD